jgi:hypothetical protein
MFDGTHDYDIQPQYGDGGFLDSSINALATGLGGSLEGAGTYLDQEFGFGSSLAKLGHDMQIGRQARTDWDMQKAMDDPLGFITDPSGLVYNTFNLIGSSAPDLAVTAAASAATGGIGGLAVGAGLKAARAANLAKAASSLEKAMEVGSKAEGIGMRGAQLIREYAPSVAGDIAGGAFDAATEAGSTYTMALENGATQDEARNAMQTDFIDNIGMSTIQNAISMNMLKGAVKTPLGIGRKEVGDATEKAGSGLLGAMSEAGGKVADFADNHFATRLMTRAVPGTAVEAYTEGLQNEFQDNAVHGYDVNYNPFNMSDESKNQMFMAAVGMVPQGLLGATRRRRVRAEENMADNNIDEDTIAQPTDNTIQNENAEPGVIATPEENVDDGNINNVAPEVIVNPVENITSPENGTIEGNTPTTTNEQVAPITEENGTEPPSFATIYDSYINDRDPINNRTAEQLATDRSNEAEAMGYNTEDKKGQLRAIQDMADTIEALDTNENSPLKQIGVKKPDISSYIKNNFTNDVANTLASGDKKVARDTLNQVADVLYYRNKKAEPERRRAANQAEAEQLTKEGSMFGLEPVPQNDKGEYTGKSISGYKKKLADTKNRIDREHNHFKLAKERQDHVPDETKFAESLSQAVDTNDREQFVKDVNQSINELSSYTTSPAKSLNRITDYFHTKAQKDAVRKAFVNYYNDRVNGRKDFQFDINKHLKSVGNIVSAKQKAEAGPVKKLTLVQKRNQAIRDTKVDISNIRNKVKEMGDDELSKTGEGIKARIDQIQKRVDNSTNKAEITYLKKLQNVFYAGKKAVAKEQDLRAKQAAKLEGKDGEKTRSTGSKSKTNRQQTRKQNADKIAKFKQQLEDENKSAEETEKSANKNPVAKQETAEQTKETKAKVVKKQESKREIRDNVSDEEIRDVAQKLWNYHLSRKEFNKQLQKRNGRYHVVDNKGNHFYYNETDGAKIKTVYNELRKAHFKEHPEDEGTARKASRNQAASRKANNEEKRAKAVKAELNKENTDKIKREKEIFNTIVKNKGLSNDNKSIDYLNSVKQLYKSGMKIHKDDIDKVMPHRYELINNIFEEFAKEFNKYGNVNVYKVVKPKEFKNVMARLYYFNKAFTKDGKPIDRNIKIPDAVFDAMNRDADKQAAFDLTDEQKKLIPKDILSKLEDMKSIEQATRQSEKAVNGNKVAKEEKVMPTIDSGKTKYSVEYNDKGKPILIDIAKMKAVIELKDEDMAEFKKTNEFDKDDFVNKYLPDGYEVQTFKADGNKILATVSYRKEITDSTHFIDKQIYDILSEEDKRKLEENGIKAKGIEGGSENGTVKGAVNSEGHEKGNEPVQRAVPEGNDVGRSGSRNNGGRSTKRSSGLPVGNAQSVQKYRETNPEVKQLYDNGNLKWDKDVKPEEVGNAIESMFYGYPESFKKTAIDLLNSMGIRIHITSKPIIVDTRGGKKNAGGLYKENTGEIIISRDKINDQIKSNSIKTRPTSAHENAHFIFSVLHKGPERDEAWRKLFNDIIKNDIKSAGVKNINELVAKESKVFTDEGIKEIEGFVSEILSGKPPSEKLQYRYYRTDDTGNGRIINAVLHRIALDDKHILKFVRDPNYFQELMVSKNTYERNRARNSLRARCLTLINKYEGKGSKTTIKDLNKLSSNEILEHAKKSLGNEYAKYKAELEKIMEDGDWVTDTAMQSITKEHIEKYKNSILEKRSKAAKDKESSVENSFYDKSTESDTVTPEQRLEKAGYKSPIQHARDSLKTYGREFIDDVKAGKGKYSYADRFWRTPEAILKDMIGGAASKIFDYAVKAQKIKNRTLQRYMGKYSHIYRGLKDNERRVLNRAILYCDKNGRDPVQVMSAGKDTYIVYRDGDFIEAYNNINDAKSKLVELKRTGEYKNGEVKMSMVAGEDGLKALVYAVKDKNRVFSKKNAADAYAKKNYKQAVADMFDDVTTEELSNEQKAKLADKFTEYRKLMDEAYADMVSVASQYDVKIPPKKQGFFPRYHLPFVVMVKDKMGTKRVTSFYNQSEAQKMAKKLSAEGVKSYVIELSPIDQIRVGINQHDREYLTDDEIKEIEEGKTMSFADMNESLEEHGEGMKLLTNLLNKRFKAGATTVPAKVILKDLSKKVQDNGRTKKQIRATGIIKEMEKYKGSQLTKEDVAKILDKCNRHGVFNAHLMHRTDADGYSFNVQNSVYRYLTDAAAYAGNEMFSQEAKKAYAQRFKRDFTLPAMNKEQAYCQEYINAVLSKRNITWLDNMLNSVLKSIPGFGAWIRKWSPNPYTDVAGKILGAQNVLKLGMFNVSSGAVQLSQLLNANAKLGGNKFIGMSKAFRFGLREAFKNKGLYNDKELNKKYGEIFDYIGLYDSIPSLDREMTGKPSWFMDKNRKFLRGKSFGDIAEASMYFFNRGDIKARQATAIGAMYKFEHEIKKDKMKEYLKKGKTFEEAEKLTHNDMLKYVDRVVRETNFDYSVVNTPLGLSGLGVTGKLIMQFKKYPFFTLNFLRGNTKEENIRFLVPLMLMGGIFGLPCLDLFDDTVATVTGVDPKLAAKKAIMEWAGNSPQRKAFANVAMYGAPSLAGIDISGRIGLNDAASFDAGPTYTTAQRLLSSAKKGDYMGMAEALTSRATVAKSLAKGGYADSHGNLITQYDNYDKMLKILGFRPVEESHGADLNRVISQSKKIMQEHTDKAIEEYKKHPTMANYQALRIYGLSDKRIATLQDEKPKKNDKSSVNKTNHSKEANDIRKLESFKQGR